MSKVVNSSEYKNRVLGGAGKTSSFSLTLDTQAPSISIENTISTLDNTVSFSLSFNSQVKSIKTWGDYDVTSQGVNHDKCGTTENTAPWITPVESIQFTLGDKSPGVQHVFYFKVRDDVWNETQVTVTGEYEPTLLIDVSDFVKSKDSYYTFCFEDDFSSGQDEAYSDMALIDSITTKEHIAGTAIKINELIQATEIDNTILSDSDLVSYNSGIYLGAEFQEFFDYSDVIKEVILYGKEVLWGKEEYQNLLFASDSAISDYYLRLNLHLNEPVFYIDFVSDGSDHRANIVIRKDKGTTIEFNSLDFMLEDHLLQNDSTFVSVPQIDNSKKTQDIGRADADILLRDELKSAVGIQFTTGEISEYTVIQDTNLINASTYDMGGPYGVFFYFAVKIKTTLSAGEYSDFLTIGSDIVDYSENINQMLIKKSVVNSFDKQNLLEKLIQKENPELTLNTYFNQNTNENTLIKSGMYNQLYSDEILESEIDYDLLEKILLKEHPKVKGIVSQDFAEKDYFISSTDVVPHLADFDVTTSFNKPWVNADINISDAGYTFDKMEFSLPTDYFSMANELSLMTLEFTEKGTIPEPKWIFEVNALEELQASSYLITSIPVNYSGGYDLSSLIAMPLTDSGSIPDPSWEFEINAFEFISDKELSVTSLEGFDSAAVYGSVINYLFGAEILYAEIDYVILEKILLKENPKVTAKVAQDFFGSDYFLYDTNVISNLVTTEDIESFTKVWADVDHLMFDSGQYIESFETGQFTIDNFVLAESGVIDAAVNDYFEYSYFTIEEIKLVIKVDSNESSALSLLNSDVVDFLESSLFSLYTRDTADKHDVLVKFEKLYQDKLVSKESQGLLFEYSDKFESSDQGVLNTYDSERFTGNDRIKEFAKSFLDTANGLGVPGISSEYSDSAVISETDILTVLPMEKAFYSADYFIDVDLLQKDSGYGFGSHQLNLLGSDSFFVYDEAVINVWTYADYDARFFVSVHKEDHDIVYIYDFDFGFGKELHSHLDMKGVDEESTGYDSAYIDLYKVESGVYNDYIKTFERLYFDSVTYKESDFIDVYTSEKVFGKGTFIISQHSSDSVTSQDLIREFYREFVYYAKAYVKKAVIGLAEGDTAGGTEDIVFSTAGKDLGVSTDTLIEFYKEFFDWGTGKDLGFVPHFSSETGSEDSSSVLNMFDKDETIGSDVLIEFYKEIFEWGKGKDKGFTSYLGTESSIEDSSAVINNFDLDTAIGRDTLIEFYKEIFERGKGKDKGYTSYLGSDLVKVLNSAIIGTHGKDIAFGEDLLIEFYKEFFEKGFGKDKGFAAPLVEDTGLEEGSSVIGTFESEKGFGRDLLIEFYKEFFDKGFGKDFGLLNLLGFTSVNSFDEAILNVLVSKKYKGYDFVAKFYKEFFDAVTGKEELKFVDLLSLDTGLYADSVVIGLDANDVGFADFKYKFTIIQKVFEEVTSKTLSCTSLAGQEFIYTKESALFLPCMFDESDAKDFETLNAYLIAREDIKLFDTVILCHNLSDEFKASEYSLINLAENEIGIVEFTYDIEEKTDVRYITVFDFGFFKVSKADLWLLYDERFRGNDEYGELNIFGSEKFKVFASYSKEFAVQDSSSYCYNTVVYDPTIAQRDIVYFWEPEYATIDTPKKPNPLWGKDIEPGDSDYPFSPGSPQYGTVIKYAVIDETAPPTYEFNLVNHFDHGGCSVYHHAFNFSLYGEMSTVVADVFKFEYNGIDVKSLNVRDGYTYKYRINLYESNTLDGTYSRIAVADISDIVDFVLESDVRYIGPSGTRKTQHYGIYSKGTTTPGVLISSLARLFGISFDFIQKYYKVQMEVYFAFESMYESGPSIEVNLDFSSYCKEWVSEPNPEYKKYRSEYVFDNDGWFRPVDIMPDLMTFKLYLNMGCGLNADFSHPPVSAMDRFVMEMQARHLYMDIVGHYSGYDGRAFDEGVINNPPKEKGSSLDIITAKDFTLLDFSYSCINTIIYDAEITQRDLMFWWEPGYIPGASVYSAVKHQLNPDWGKDIEPGDIDYPYYKNDPEYGSIISLYSKHIRTYASMLCNKSWVGDGTQSTVVSDSTRTLFTAYSTNFNISTYNIEVVETYCFDRPIHYIPWTTNLYLFVEGYHYNSSGEYEYLGKKIIQSNKSKSSQEWVEDNKLKTIYVLNPETFSVDCNVVFPGYDLSKDYFVVSIYVGFSWTGRWQQDTNYAINGLYMYYGDYQALNPHYAEVRRQYIPDNTDQWFVANDVLYYEPTNYKLYLNLECGPVPFIDRIPENPMDKFVLDKMTKYAKLNILASFVGDHAAAIENPVINPTAIDIGIYKERLDIAYTLLFKDAGYFCEDIVIYSADGVQDRDLLYWWQKDYPVVVNDNVYVANPLLGKAIEVNDFDYPYDERSSHYGEVILPGKHKVTPDFEPYSYITASISYNLDIPFYFPIRELTDGAELVLNGHVRADVGAISFKLVVFWKSDAVESSPIIGTGNGIYPYDLVDIFSVSSEIKDYTDKGDIVYKFKDKIFRNIHYTVRTQDIIDGYNKKYPNTYLNYPDWSTGKFYLGLLAIVSPAEINIHTTALNNYKYAFRLDVSVGIEEYDPTYLMYRKPGVHLTDLGFVTKDFYDDFMGLKFYVNLGCGPDLDAFPIEYSNDFERWIFTTARLGDRNIDYLYSGTMGPSSDVAIEEFVVSKNINVTFRVKFNNYEFTVKDIGTFDYSSVYSVLGNEDVVFDEKYPVIDIPENIIGDLSHAMSFYNTVTFHEYGTFEVTPLMDSFMAESIDTVIATPVIDIPEEAHGDATFVERFAYAFSFYERALGVGQEIVAVPIDGQFIYDSDITITIPAAIDIDFKDHLSIVEFVYVYDKGTFTGAQLLDDPINTSFLFTADQLINVATGYVAPVKERIRPDRNEIYQEIGYVCLWVQIVNYPFVIDWLAGHFVDYFNNAMEAEYVRLVTCFGNPPGGWPKVPQYPSPEYLLPHPINIPTLKKKDGEPYYRYKEPHVDGRERKHGYIVISGPGGTIYILDPVDPPEPYEWAGGTAILLTKSIMDEEMQEYLTVVDAFYFALFDEFDNRVSDVKCMIFKDTTLSDGSILAGSSFGALVFFDLNPETTYYVKETDEYGNIITIDFTSRFSLNKYTLPQSSLKVSTGEEGKCVDAGDSINLIKSFGRGTDKKKLPIGDNYDPWVYHPESDYPKHGPKAPFIVKPASGGGGGSMGPGPFTPKQIPPVTDGDYYPPIYPYPYGPNVPPENPEDLPGYIGRLVHPYDSFVIVDEGHNINIPVDMWASVWAYHYIPATFILELTGMRIELLEDYDFEIEEPFRFAFTGFDMEVEEPFSFDLTGFSIEVDPGFVFAEESIITEYVQEFYLEDIKFEFEMQFEDFKFDWVEYDGEQITPAPEVIAEILTYDGTPHFLCRPRGVYGTILYQLDGETTWSTDIPQKVDAGSYVVNWYAMASLEYTGYGSESDYHVTHCSIHRASAIVDLSKVSVDYKSTQQIEFYYHGDGEVSCSSDNRVLCDCEIVDQQIVSTDSVKVTMKLIGKSCGLCDIHIVGSVGANYMSVDQVVTCYVNEGTLTVTAQSVTSQYTGKPIDSKIFVADVVDYDIYYSSKPINATTTDYHKTIDFYTEVGAYTVYFVVKADNYKPYYGKFNLTITLIPQDISFDVYSGEFDYKAHPLINSVIGNYGTMWYSVNKLSWSANIPMGAIPGTYTIYWYCVGDENHYNVGTSKYPNVVVVNIEKITSTAQIDNVTIAMDTPELVIEIPTQSLGLFSISCLDSSIVSIDIVGKSVVIKPIKQGGTFVYIKQFEDFFYKEHTFSFHVEVV